MAALGVATIAALTPGGVAAAADRSTVPGGGATAAEATVLDPAAPQPVADLAAADETGPYWLVFGHSNKCLAVPGGSPDNVQLIQYNCQPGTLDQHWYYVWDGGHNWFMLRNRKTGKCVDVKAGDSAKCTPIIQYTCNTSHRN